MGVWAFSAGFENFGVLRLTNSEAAESFFWRGQQVEKMQDRPSSGLKRIQRLVFRVISRSANWTYSRIPIFGALRASIAIIRRGELILVIDRSDGRGLSFPGGFDWPWENPEASVRREIAEETGLAVERATLLSQYRSSADIPVDISVFEIEADGELKESWEGAPRWVQVSELRTRLLPSQQPVIDRFLI
jgi:8-oxo-dGTP pyrophosphatase MutT (NUDIX family)